MLSKILIVICVSLIWSTVVCAAKPFGGRIVGGQLAKPGQFPYIVSIQENVVEEEVNGHYCGASILNSQWIVTAGHCIASPLLEDYQILAGTNLLNTSDGGVRYNITKTIQHPDFNLTAIRNDIGLIKIDGEFIFSDTIATIEIGAVVGNESTVTLGWGSTENEVTPNALRFIEVTALSLEDCERLAEGSTYGTDYPPRPENVCAVTVEGKGACHGDSGSPLVYDNTLVGLTSHSLEVGCASEYPDVFTRVAYFKDWIEATISSN